MSKKEYITKELITCIGNKRALVDFIEEEIVNIKKELGKEEIISFDGFSGSGSVARLLKYHSSQLYVNDLEKYSYIVNSCYLKTPSKEDQIKINNIIDELNNLDFNVEGIICNHYAPKNTNNVTKDERAFYTRENALIIDTIRKKINEYPEYFNHLIAPLLVKASINANTSGVFKGFHKKGGVGHFGGKDEVNTESRITKKIVIEKPLYSDQNHSCNVEIFNKDINQLIKNLPHVDIAYLDPPYNQHPYGSNYFMLNTIIDNEITGKLSKVSGIPDNWNRSDYNYPKSASNAMKDLLLNMNAKYIIMSYNNEGHLSEDEIKKIIESLNYSYEIKKKKYNTYRGSRNLNNREKKVDEQLWIIKKFDGNTN